ncbi:Uncharacterised protein [uncultured archaeon]|nr:Uncharacterised protein [uncultured archaeon]
MKTKMRTSEVRSGFMNDQRKPSAEFLYRFFRSATTRFHISSRYL